VRKNIKITYNDGSSVEYHVDHVGQPQNGILVLLDVDGQFNKHMHIPMASIKHYEVQG